MVVRVAICGAGISGLALAVLLQKRSNIHVRVYEPSLNLLSASGEAMLHPGAIKVLEAAGLLEEVEQMATNIEDIRFVHATTGVDLGQQSLVVEAQATTRSLRSSPPPPPQQQQQQQQQQPSHLVQGRTLCVRRNDFVQLLARRLPEGVVQYGRRVVGVDEEGGFVRVKMELVCSHNSEATASQDDAQDEDEQLQHEEIECDVVIGADGRHSRVRRCTWGEEGSEEQYSAGWSVIAWQLDECGSEELLQKCVQGKKVLVSVGDGHVCGLYPTGQSSLCAFVGFTDAFGSTHNVRDSILDSDTDLGRKERMQTAKSIAKMHCDPTFNLAAEVAEWFGNVHSQPYVWRVSDMLPPSCLASGRIALVGDAAHTVVPLLMMGATLALESACICADAITAVADGETDMESALGVYSQVRWPRGAAMVRESRYQKLPQGWTQMKILDLVQWMKPQQLVRALGPQRFALSYDATVAWLHASSKR